MKTFTVAGTSIENGELKFRVANDLAGRIVMLERCGNTAINLIALPEPMCKEDAAAWLLKQPSIEGAQKALFERVAAKEKAPAREPAERKTRTVKPAKPVAAPSTFDDDGFVEPTDERIQVAMSRLARQHRGLSAHQLYEQVMLTNNFSG